MARYGLKGLGWLLCVFTAPAFYMIMSAVAAERGKVESLDTRIAETRRTIETLKTEFDTRSNIGQLMTWNGEVLSMVVPQPAQYLTGADAIAQVGRLEATGAPVAVAQVVRATELDTPAAMTAAISGTDAPRAEIMRASVPVTTVPVLAPVARTETARAEVTRAEVTRAETARAEPRVATGTTKVAMLGRRMSIEAAIGGLRRAARAEEAGLR